MILRICHCSHDRDTHYESQHSCLGMLCDCTSYRDRDVPLPKPVKAAPVVEEESPVTPRVSHPQWCTCPACMFGGP